MTLRELADHLARLDLDSVGSAALAARAEQLATVVRDALSNSPGDRHEYPWRRTGSLHDSIASEAAGAEAIVGSTSDVALYQEFGTEVVPPRPFLGPIAEARAAEVAASVGLSIIRAISAGAMSAG